jgi:hypothetical protein
LSSLLRSPWRDLLNKGDLSHEKILYLLCYLCSPMYTITLYTPCTS